MSDFTEKQQIIGAHIIGNLDQDGYLRATIEEIAHSTGAKKEEIEIEFIDREKEKTPEEKGLKETLKEIFRHRGFEEEEGEEEYYEEYE